MKKFPPSIRAMFAGHSLRAGPADAEGSGAAGIATDAALAPTGDAPEPRRAIQKNPPAPSARSPRTAAAILLPLNRAAGGGAFDEATGSRVLAPAMTGEGPSSVAAAARGVAGEAE